MLNRKLFKELRLKRRFTLEQLGRLTDSGKSYMWELENKKLQPSAEKLYKISKALKVPMEYFFDGYVETETLFRMVSCLSNEEMQTIKSMITLLNNKTKE